MRQLSHSLSKLATTVQLVCKSNKSTSTHVPTRITVVRTPSKLTELMLLRSVRQETLDEHLTMHQGNIKDAEAVEKALVNKDGSCRDMIIYGIGTLSYFTS